MSTMILMATFHEFVVVDAGTRMKESWIQLQVNTKIERTIRCLFGSCKYRLTVMLPAILCSVFGLAEEYEHPKFKKKKKREIRRLEQNRYTKSGRVNCSDAKQCSNEFVQTTFCSTVKLVLW